MARRLLHFSSGSAPPHGRAFGDDPNRLLFPRQPDSKEVQTFKSDRETKGGGVGKVEGGVSRQKSEATWARRSEDVARGETTFISTTRNARRVEWFCSSKNQLQAVCPWSTYTCATSTSTRLSCLCTGCPLTKDNENNDQPSFLLLQQWPGSLPAKYAGSLACVSHSIDRPPTAFHNLMSKRSFTARASTSFSQFQIV